MWLRCSVSCTRQASSAHGSAGTTTRHSTVQFSKRKYELVLGPTIISTLSHAARAQARRRAHGRAGPKLDQSNTNSPLDLVCFQAARTLSPSRRVQCRCRVQSLVRARHTASSSRNPLHCHRIRPELCALRRHASQACNSAQSSTRSHPHAPFPRKDGSSSHTAVHSGSSEARFASPAAFF